MKVKGICFVCGCTYENPCEEGCAWANMKQTLCTACVSLPEAERKQKKEESLEQLGMDLAEALAEAEHIILRAKVLGVEIEIDSNSTLQVKKPKRKARKRKTAAGS